MLRRKNVLALTGMLFALGATPLDGSGVPVNSELSNDPAIGLDRFLLRSLFRAQCVGLNTTRQSAPRD